MLGRQPFAGTGHADIFLMPLGRPLAVQLHPSTPQAGDAVGFAVSEIA